LTSDGGDVGERLEVRLLGGLEVRYDGIPLPVAGQRSLCVLAVLLLNRGHTVSRSDLAEWAWPGPAPDTVERQITNYVAELRGALAPAGNDLRLVARDPGFVALIDPARVDLDRFSALVAQARTARAGYEYDVAADRLHAALDLWRGQPWEGLDTPYLRARADALEGQRRDAVLELAELDLAAGRSAEATASLRDLVARHPEHEAITVALIRALTGTGQTAEAADVAARAQRAIQDQGHIPTSALQQAHSDALTGRPARPAVRPAGSRHQLPADTGAFVGREYELVELLSLAKQAQGDQHSGTALVCTLAGLAGAGKTALAVHAAHRLLDQFPDGQLFVDLRGHHEGLPPRDPADALGSLLPALGVPPQEIPDGLDARSALYRDRLAGSRTLIILDDAATDQQVLPLLPAHDQCLVVVTGRQQLKALDHARVLTIGALPEADAVALFREVAGPDRIRADDPLLTRIIDHCGRLPLALRITGALFRHRPAWSLAYLAERLCPAPPRLAGFDDGHRSVAAVFDASYRVLDDDLRRTFRSLGVAPGPDIGVWAAAALLHTTPRQAERWLEDLVDHNLLTEPLPGRYRLHDLLRTYAADLTAEQLQEPDFSVDRLIDHYQHTASHAATLVATRRRARTVDTAPSLPPAYRPDLREAGEAWTWLRSERANLETVFDDLVARRADERVVALASALASVLRADGPWQRARQVHSAAEQAADRLGDRAARATALTELAHMRSLTGDYAGALADATSALRHYQELDRPADEASVLTHLGHIRWMSGDYAGAQQDQQAALDLFVALGDRFGEGRILTDRGELRRMTGDFAAAADDQRAAVAIFLDLGDRAGQARALTMLGEVRCLTGEYAAASSDLERALAIYRELGNRFGEANVLTYRADVRAEEGDHDGAAQDIDQALDTFRLLGSRANEAWALVHQATLVARAGDTDRALILYRAGLAMSREVTHPDDEALALEGIGECLVRLGDAAGGADHLRQAREIFAGLGMRADLARLEHRLAAL
jgi:DNA-binding SARP family transcriptional activator